MFFFFTVLLIFVIFLTNIASKIGGIKNWCERNHQKCFKVSSLTPHFWSHQN